MAQMFRLDRGGRLNRSRPVAFLFNGTPIEGYEGDTVASALLANGQHLVARSFKYHRPRGILSAGSEEPNALLQVDRGAGRADPNNRATMLEARAGLRVTSQNHWPTLEVDFGEINDHLAPLFAAGFYYKTFMWPATFWKKLYEPVIRRAAGLGIAPTRPDVDHYQQRFAHCDVLIVGAGPAGLAAALAASADDQKRVMLVDEQAEPGGTLLHEPEAMIDSQTAWVWLDETLSVLRARKNVVLLTRTTAFGYYNHNFLTLAERLTDHLAHPAATMPREKLWQVRAAQVVLATGAHERPLLFADNDRPGIMLAESMRVYLNRYGVRAGRQLIIATNGAAPYVLAMEAAAADMAVSVVDFRREAACGPEVAAARARGCTVFTGHTITGSVGRIRIAGVHVAFVDDSGLVGVPRTLACDCLAMHGGFNPNVQMFSQSRGKLTFDEALDAFVPGHSVQAVVSSGASRGIYDLAACLADGWSAGGGGARSFAASPSTVGFQPTRLLPTYGDTRRQKAFVDFQNDVTTKDLKLAVREGFTSVEHVKRYTTTGMATDQGKTSNMNALGVVARELGKPIPEVGTTTFRLPYTPVTFGAFAGVHRGARFEPVRHTPMHQWAAAHGGVFEDVGQWKRALYFPRGAETMDQSVARECQAVRTAAGMFDASTLGKIEVVGPDAAEFLNRIYFNEMKMLGVGRARYGLMLKEDGYVFDDGIAARLAPDRFHITTTTGGAARVLMHMEDYMQTEWPGLQVTATSITEQWAVIAVQGPRAREVIAPLISGIDLSNAAMPHMSLREGLACGFGCRLFRVSFTGELGFEINVPANLGPMVWEAVLASGAAVGIVPYGTQAMHVLRAEKGYVIIGQETDGTVVPADLGMAAMTPRTKPDFVGQRGLMRADFNDHARRQLVGLLSEDVSEVLEEGAQIVASPSARVPIPALGHVTSAYRSAALGKPIALALLDGGMRRAGSIVNVTNAAGFARARVCAPVFYDPKGERVHG